ILTKLHLLRMKGNKAAHGEVINYKQEELLNLLKETYLLGKWFYLQQIPASLYPNYQLPTNIPSNNEEKEKQIIALKNELDKLLSNEEKIAQENKYLKTQLSEQQINSERENKSNQYKTTADNLDLDNYHTLENISLIDCYNEYVLTEGQKSLIDKLSQFFNNKEKNIFLLKGYAGTGKTFIMKGVSNYLSLMNRDCSLIAPTGKAAKVLANKTGKIATTIHSKIYNLGDLIEYEDEGNPNTYKFYANLKVNEDSSNNVYIIDESSMISDVYSDSEFIRFGSGYLLHDLMKYINLDQNDHTKKIIFIGDDAQLPPIGMDFSPALLSDYILNKFN
ncbi:TPA: AAA family ATPase, partial [Haemophilus influenzae]